eukprot:gnl/TRDRNA2_/TRDRNA2_163347_c1_seq1.p1 gnl/TRDRNA2_/TRDRNA2_163347_c1~~gnl/TRDRNA2_/TRDRNA2_163347_c1_seq1.p1  ORF type:complete len:116 (-),score=15.83 gnl/TRDRNA2_/TRDRNA2_163347_c1_seq1:247-594(-)
MARNGSILAITSSRLLTTAGVLPYFEDTPACPSCPPSADGMISCMALLASAEFVCSVCAEGDSGSGTWAMPAQSCGVCGTVVCLSCNQMLQFQRMVEDAKQRILGERDAEAHNAE